MKYDSSDSSQRRALFNVEVVLNGGGGQSVKLPIP